MARPNNLTLCSFCGKSHAEVKKLIAGPGVYICDNCITLCKCVLDKELLTCCSFCGKPRTEVKKLIAGSGVYICNSCILLCKSELDKEPPFCCNVCGKPHAEAVNVVAGGDVVNICDDCLNHYKNVLDGEQGLDAAGMLSKLGSKLKLTTPDGTTQ
jgi:hypothetical protein